HPARPPATHLAVDPTPHRRLHPTQSAARRLTRQRSLTTETTASGPAAAQPCHRLGCCPPHPRRHHHDRRRPPQQPHRDPIGRLTELSGLTPWVTAGDQSRACRPDGTTLGQLPAVTTALPRQFDDATTDTI